VENSFVLVDIGAQCTKSILVEKKGGEYLVSASGSAATTVDKPGMDVTDGIIESLKEIEKAVGVSMFDGDKPTNSNFFFSSGASGGLHMVVTGLIGMISSDSAQRAALGAGALLIDLFSKDDGRPIHRKVATMRSMKPDILLMAGGTDGGAVDQVLEMTDIVKEADVKPRFGPAYPLPVIFAGNVKLQEQVDAILTDGYATKMVENVRPIIDRENLGPARESIYDAYMEHVLVHSPGFDRVTGWSSGRVLPSQAAVGKILYSYAQSEKINLIGVDVGGDTTDVYSVFDGVFNRSLNADIGLTYGLSNILKSSGIDSILGWLSVPDEREVRNLIGNMMVKHPDHMDSRLLEVQGALAREAIQLGLVKHRDVASRLKGSLIGRTISDMFEQALDSTRINLMKTNLILGKGKVFTQQTAENSALVLIDSIQPEGFTEIALDSNGYTPHLGNLYDLDPEGAMELFNSKCLNILGTCVAPVGPGRLGSDALRINFETGGLDDVTVPYGEVNILPIREENVEASFAPIRMDLGNGKGRTVTKTVRCGSLGLIIDTRGRPVERQVKPVGLISLERRVD
jgi:hypothetical protein